jgi:acyl-coenzyme A thioesterase 9
MSHPTKVALQRTCQTLRANSIQSQLQSTLATRRGFSSSFSRRTDGVFRELTSMRVRTPWVKALREQQQGGKQPIEKSEVPRNRDLPPKRMSDSYHSVVLPLARDPWLLDTYLNSSGHIRLGTIFMDLDALSGVIA